MSRNHHVRINVSVCNTSTSSHSKVSMISLPKSLNVCFKGKCLPIYK